MKLKDDREFTLHYNGTYYGIIYLSQNDIDKHLIKISKNKYHLENDKNAIYEEVSK